MDLESVTPLLVCNSIIKPVEAGVDSITKVGRLVMRPHSA